MDNQSKISHNLKICQYSYSLVKDYQFLKNKYFVFKASFQNYILNIETENYFHSTPISLDQRSPTWKWWSYCWYFRTVVKLDSINVIFMKKKIMSPDIDKQP